MPERDIIQVVSRVWAQLEQLELLERMQALRALVMHFNAESSGIRLSIPRQVDAFGEDQVVGELGRELERARAKARGAR